MTDSNDIPARIAAAVCDAHQAQLAHRQRLETIADEPVTAGDIWIAGNGTYRQPVVVSAVSVPLVRTFTCHGDVAAAYDSCLIVDPRDAFVPYPLVVVTELYGTLFTGQLRRRVGRLDRERLNAVRDAYTTDGESLERHRTGPPLRGAVDWRRMFHTGPLFATHTALCGPSRRMLLTGRIGPLANRNET